ncbi:MAG TPA: hypothetical protein VM695_04015 [Phycisphaerae bacterium]|nr:hypothetical protein [Phycisphaerae bacterium]
MSRQTIAWVLLAAAGAPAARGETPAEYLRRLPRPVFAAGHTLPPLTRYGWTLPLDARVELAEHWGYCLEFGGYTTEKVVARLDDPNSIESKLVALAASDPKRYPLCVICSRDLPTDVSPGTWTRTADGRLVSDKGEVQEPNQPGKAARRTWSPEAPDSVFREAGRLRADPIRKVRAKAPIAIVLNGGEYALSVPGHHAKAWSLDPRIVKAKGDMSWFEYVSRQKARQEGAISEAVRRAVPDRTLYIYYPCGGGTHRNRWGGWPEWCWGYQWMHPISDLPSNETYYKHFNTGWAGEIDMLTMALNAKGHEIALARPLSYNWLCAGWPRGDDPNAGLGDLALYLGFLKCYYAAGMIGGNAGYYAYPKGGFGAAFGADAPPHWLRQMVALARVHALFSHLEGYLREGDLLPGPNRHRWSKDQPAYELPTGQPATRVVARRMRKAPKWLLAAWAADGQARRVTVSVPDLGEVALDARPCGSVYRAELAGGAARVELIDRDGLLPTTAGLRTWHGHPAHASHGHLARGLRP